MAKIQNFIFIILFLCIGCSDSVSKTGISESDIVENPKEVLADETIPKDVIIIDSIPVIVTEKDSVVALAPVAPVVPKPLAKPSLLKPVIAKKSITEIYLSQVGVREKTGKNDGVDVEKYLRSVGLGKGYAWCAAFVRWCFDQAGIKTKINGAAATCLNMKDLVLWKHKFLKDPEPGDVFVLWFNSLNRIAHTGFFNKKINSSVYETVEGNTSEGGTGIGSREGDGVYRKIRSFNATYAISRFP